MGQTIEELRQLSDDLRKAYIAMVDIAYSREQAEKLDEIRIKVSEKIRRKRREER